MPQCPRCQGYVGADYRFCPNCGVQLQFFPATWAAAPEWGGVSPPRERPSRAGVWIAVAAVIVVALIAFVALVPLPLITQSSTPAGTSSTILASCPADTGSKTTASEPNPNYDVQEVMIFTQSYSQLMFNLTATAQCDSYGYGPAYLLNGLTNTGYWYQVGLNWDWPLQTGGYVPGFSFVSEYWAPGGVTHPPSSSPFSGTVRQNDIVELSINFTGGKVVLSGRDLNTSAVASTNFPANRANTFVGLQEQQSRSRFSFATQGYFTGLMTEWYHVRPTGEGPGIEAKYTKTGTPISSATLAIGEWNFTGANPTSVFSGVANNGYPVDFSGAPNQLQQFSYNGLVASADAFEFVTGV